MSLPILKRPRALMHLAEHFSFIYQDEITPAEEFLKAPDASFARLSESPRMGVRWRTRLVPLKNIPMYPMPEPYRKYVIYYQVHRDAIEIMGINHGTRNTPTTIREIGL